jgi:hypothetical protein
MLREAALALFLIAVALGLWLADVRPVAVVGVMALALAVAWVIEWVSWREDQLQGIPPVRQEIRTTEIAAEPPPITAEPPPVPEPVPAPAPRARGLWLRRPRRTSRPAEDVVAQPPEDVPAPPEAERARRPTEASEDVGPAHGADASEGAGAGHAPPGTAVTPGPEPPAPEEPPPSKRRLQPVQSAAPSPPTPAPERPAPPQPLEPQGAPVVPLWAGSSQPREWNLWDLERIARAQSRRNPERFEEWSYVFLHLRRFATADGMLPAEFDGLVRDYFGGLLEPAQGA